MQFSFDATNVDISDDRSFEPLPKGKYTAMVVESSIKPTKAGTGQIMELVCQIIDGQYMNRKIWWRLNITNPNPDTEKYARRDLAKLRAQLGLAAQMQDTQELHGKPFGMGLKVREQAGYEPSNDVSFTAAVSGPVAAAPAMAQPNGRPQPPTAAPSAAPWA